MDDNKKWIEELKERIIDDNDIVLFNEATNCFLAKNYRASYIMSWICIVESLKKKIQLFSNLGDLTAVEAFNQIETFEEEKKSTDKLIYQESNKCGIIDNADLSTINFLWEQRCLFAHPYNKQPEEDEVKHILIQSIKLVLGKELLYNKKFLTQLSDNIVDKPFFLPTETERIREFARRIISRTPKELHPFFFKTLLFRVGKIALINEKLNELKKLRYFLLELFVNTPLSLEIEDWSLEHRVTNYPYECFIGIVHKESWHLIPKRIKEMLISYFINESDIFKSLNIKSIIVSLVKVNKLEEDLKAQYFEKLNRTDFNSSINFYGDNGLVFIRVIDELASWQFEQQNVVISYLREHSTFEFLDELSSEKQFVLGRLLKACASHNHWSSQNLISSIIDNSTKMPDNIKAGIVYGSFINWNDNYSFDKDFLMKAIRLLNDVDEDIQKSTYDQLNIALKDYSPTLLEKMVYDESALLQVVEKIFNSIDKWKGNNKEYFENLIEQNR
ncbi:hypothetical protein [Tenacibaculum maritimum]|uniref:hypothetical protein n=1 Tax=Tenacibaculum maritimum TaxID=107401 RepID=UPI0012E3FD72|nr:hypothetical protein [Tenacibaculum maritimum]MCD9562448.1 hypothetical protein [Tenacibaculum maritimum]MCD9564476.1 hypothetical protein [Tenacibaculum maritimum]MCD9578173.1 hypothetical protein [Tenacibaculum maritimum]MCD9595568.1 hypothetical protein [Tenacibaculum maritimum]MCD9612782.1 hypothetical protein [Tenacibaculum maritimum]